MENFEKEKLEIKIRVAELLQIPAAQFEKIILQIPREQIEKSMIIFVKVYGKMRANSGQIPGDLVVIFPAFLSALSGNFSEDRVEFLAESLINLSPK